MDSAKDKNLVKKTKTKFFLESVFEQQSKFPKPPTAAIKKQYGEIFEFIKDQKNLPYL